MTSITYDLSPEVFSALRLSPDEFEKEMRIAACVQWYSEGVVSQAKAAELAELNRAAFLEELFRRRVPAVQVTFDELKQELEGE